MMGILFKYNDNERIINMNIWLELVVPLGVAITAWCSLRLVIIIREDKGSSLAQTCIFSIMTAVFTLLWLRGF